MRPTTRQAVRASKSEFPLAIQERIYPRQRPSSPCFRAGSRGAIDVMPATRRHDPAHESTHGYSEQRSDTYDGSFALSMPASQRHSTRAGRCADHHADHNVPPDVGRALGGDAENTSPRERLAPSGHADDNDLLGEGLEPGPERPAAVQHDSDSGPLSQLPEVAPISLIGRLFSFAEYGYQRRASNRQDENHVPFWRASDHYRPAYLRGASTGVVPAR